MKKTTQLVAILVVMVMAITMTGCASMLKSMGGISKADLAERDLAMGDKIKALEARIDELNAVIGQANTAIKQAEEVKKELEGIRSDLAKLDTTVADLAKLKESLDVLHVRVSKLTDDTLLELVNILQKALEEKQAKPQQATESTPTAAPSN
jgi:cob(I)alamin adenosyltransferase